MTTAREFVRDVILSRDMVDRFLDESCHNVGVFDAQLGYLPHPYVQQAGLDGICTINRFEPSGSRLMTSFADRPCRINTYGDSFTHGSQVSDNETWQEYLAAHLGEPIRNFGVGGYGVYHAYRRMRREECGPSGAEYVVLNIFSADHIRSIFKWRWLIYSRAQRAEQRPSADSQEFWGFNSVPWPYLRLDPDKGSFEECQNPCPTPDSLYLFCDADYVLEHLWDDFDFQAALARHHVTDFRPEILQRTADALDHPTDFSTPEASGQTATRLLQVCGLRSSIYVVDRVRDLLRAQGKKLMVLLSFSGADMVSACSGQPRWDQLFVDYLEGSGLPWVDGLQQHLQDFRAFRSSPQEYVRRYYIGHYGPSGNHFFAFAIKSAIVGWLDPPPPLCALAASSQSPLGALRDWW